MPNAKMHADEVDIDASLVGRLVATQFPQWAALPIANVHSAGTDNAMYRLGDDMVVRLPRIPGAARQVDKEQRWLPHLAPHLPLDLPVPLGKGVPGEGYGLPWSVYRWLDGDNAYDEPIVDLGHAAVELGRFVAALRQVDATGGRRPFAAGRSGPAKTTCVPQSETWARMARWTQRPPPPHGRKSSGFRNGTANPSGSTATSCRETYWCGRADSAPSSTSVDSASAIPHAT